MKLLSYLSLFLLMPLLGRAQEFVCKVKVLHEKITGVDPQVFTTLERSITELMNTRKWTADDYQPFERIECNLLLNITDKIGEDNAYSATLNIQASRPVYNSGYTSPLVNYIDRDIAFSYSQFTPMQFDENRISGANPMESNLTAILAYYAYLMLGLDADSFSPNGGTVYFKKAQNIVNNAPEQKTIVGWKAFDSKINRYWIVDQLLSPRFSAFHTFWYMMHREGFDTMYNKPADARKKILGGIATLQQLQRENPGSALMQFLFNAKSDELLRIVAQTPKEERIPYINTLAQTDASNAARYNSLK